MANPPGGDGTYDSTQLSEPLYQLRFLIGDTTKPFQVSDAELNFWLNFYTQSGNSDAPIGGGISEFVLLECADCILEFLVGAYAYLTDKTVGSMTLHYSQQVQQIQAKQTEVRTRKTIVLRRHPGTFWMPATDYNVLQGGPLLSNFNYGYDQLIARIELINLGIFEGVIEAEEFS